MPAALSFSVGPAAVELTLDAALAAKAPASWREPHATATLARARVNLVEASEAPTFADAHPYRDGRFCGGGCRLRRTISADAEVIDGECVADPLALARAIRFATQPLLATRGWLLLHASSVVLDGRAHLFVATSGTGKSTLARALAGAGATLLGDEVAAVGPEGVAVHPGQAPHGELGRVAPLGTIHLLARGGPRTETVSKTRAIAELLTQAMVYEDGPEAIDTTLRLVSELVSRTTVVRTSVPLGDGALAHFGLLGAAR